MKQLFSALYAVVVAIAVIGWILDVVAFEMVVVVALLGIYNEILLT